MKTIFSLLLVIASFPAWSQGFAGKTNEIHLDHKNNPKATVPSLPEIVWLRPSVEHTNSQNNQIEIEALVNSSLPLTEVRIRVTAAMRGEVLGTTVVKKEEMTQNKFKKKVFLFEGQNTIDIIAEN